MRGSTLTIIGIQTVINIEQLITGIPKSLNFTKPEHAAAVATAVACGRKRQRSREGLIESLKKSPNFKSEVKVRSSNLQST